MLYAHSLCNVQHIEWIRVEGHPCSDSDPCHCADLGGGREAAQPHSTSQKVSEALPPLQLSDFERNLAAQWDMHSNGSASPTRQVPSWPQPPAAGPSMPVPELKGTSVLPAGDHGPLQQGKVGDHGTDALMAMLMNTGQVDLQQGAQHAGLAQPDTPPPGLSSRSASPRPALHPGLPPLAASPGHLRCIITYQGVPNISIRFVLE